MMISLHNQKNNRQNRNKLKKNHVKQLRTFGEPLRYYLSLNSEKNNHCFQKVDSERGSI